VYLRKLSESTAPPSPAVAIGSGAFSGHRTQVVDLGMHQLGGTVWVNWVLRGPHDARAIFSLRLAGADGGGYTWTSGPMSYGRTQSITATHSLSIAPVDVGHYRVLMVETVRLQWVGYAARFTVFASQATQ